MNDNKRSPLDRAVQKNPALEKLLSQLSEQELAKLQAALADPEATRKVLATPAAQQMLRKLSGEDKK